MISFIEGKLESKNFNCVVVSAYGVGYEIFVSMNVSEKLLETGSHVRLYTHHHVREDLQQLFGFWEKEEREFFRLLISVSGIGPKGAMGLLGAIRFTELQRAIVAEDVDKISSSPGIGKKTAQRLILELKGKISLMLKESSIEVAPRDKDQEVWNEALLALVSLGYNQATAQKALKKTAEKHQETQTLEELVRKSLNYV